MIHERAVVHPDTVLGENVTIWQFASVIRGARIGDGTSVAACAVVDGATVGVRCSIGHGAQVHPGTIIEDEVFIGPGAIICNDMWPRVSKEGFDAEALRSRATVRIGRGASVGAGAIVLPGVVIGSCAMVAAGAICRDSVSPGHVLYRSGEENELPPSSMFRMRWAR